MRLCLGNMSSVISVATGGPSVFVPSTLTPTIAYRADLGVTLTAGKVSAWADQSGHGNHMVQASAVARPVVGTMGTKSAIVSDFVNTWMSTPAFVGGDITDRSYLFVGKNNGSHTTTAQVICDGLSANKRSLGLLYANTTVLQVYQAGGPYSTTFATATTHVPFAYLCTVSNFGLATVYMLQSGVWVVSGAAGDAGANPMDGMTLFAGYTHSADKWDGSVSEVSVFPRILSAGDRTTLATYLHSEYGL